MTIDEVQQVLVDHEVAITYLGQVRVESSRPPRYRFSCIMMPTRGARRWKREEVVIRGSGESLSEAVDDAMLKLSVFLLTRPDHAD